MKTKKEIWKEVNSFVNEYFEDSYGVMVTGSFVTEYFNQSSDVDIIILSGLFRKVFIDTYDYHGIKMQAIVFPVYDLKSVLSKDITNGGIYLNQINKGIIVKDKNNLFRDFKILSDSIYQHGPDDITKYDIEQYRSRITSRLEDLEGNDDFGDNLFTLIDLYPRILDLHFKANGQWAFSGKSASRFLKKNNEQFYKLFTSSIETFINNKNKKPLVDFTRQFLKSVGGEMHFFTTREYCKVEISNSLVVFISTNYPEKQNLTLENLAVKIQKFICKNVSCVEAFSYIYPDKRIYKSGLYLIFYAEKEKINEEILPLIEAFHIDLSNSQYQGFAQNFYYPYINNPLDVFGEESIQKEVIHFVNKVKDHKEENAELYMCKVLNQILHISFFTDKETRYSFAKFCYNVLESSNNSLYITKRIKDYYHKNRLETNKLLYKKIESTINDINLNEHSWIRESVTELTKKYDNDIIYSTNFSQEGLLNDSRLKGHVSFCIFMINLVEITLNSVVCNNNSKLFVVYSILKKVNNE